MTAVVAMRGGNRRKLASIRYALEHWPAAPGGASPALNPMMLVSGLIGPAATGY
jgi:hypothetical protein